MENKCLGALIKEERQKRNITPISALATSKTVARITSNRKAEYSIERETESLLSELRMSTL